MSKLFIRKDFKATKGDYIDIYEYLYMGGSDKLPKFTHEEEDFLFSIELKAKDKGHIDVECFLYKKGDEEPLYKTAYSIFDYECLYNVFMIDTNYKVQNELGKEVDEDIEFYFTFSNEEDHDLNENELAINIAQTILEPIGRPISNIFALIKYSSLTKNDLFRMLFQFVSNLYEIDDLIYDLCDKSYFLNQLEYLKTKLSLAGYDKDYLIENYSEYKNIMDNDEKLNYLLIVTLDYLYNNCTDLIVGNEKLQQLNKDYYNELMDAI